MRRALMALAIAGSTGTVALAQESPAPSPARSISVRGWTRTSIEATATAHDDEDAAAGTGVPHDDMVARELLYGRARYLRGRFDATGAVLLKIGVFHSRPAPRFGDGASASLDGEIREAYIGYSVSSMDLRAGLQRVAWGRGDIFSPNDVVNARDLRDPVLNENELRRVPTFALRADTQLTNASLHAILQPRFERDRYDIFGTNWALVQPDAPRGYRGLLGALMSKPRATREAALLVASRRPAGLSGTQAGIRIDWRVGRFDVTNYYHYGYHGTPNFRVAPAVVAALNAVDWRNTAAAATDQIIAGIAPFIGSGWQRRQHIGLDVLTTTGPWVLRLDAAYQQPALFYDRTFNGWLSPAIETAAGLEYQTGSLGRTVSIESRFRHIVNEPPKGGLLYVARDSIDVATLARWSWSRIDIEARTAIGLRPSSLLFRPQARWKAHAFTISTGIVLLRGSDFSYADWYRRNRAVYLMLRKDF